MKEYKDESVGIYLRMMTYDDTEKIVEWRNSDSVRKRFIYQGLFTKEGHENWIKTMVETGKVVQMIICENGTDKAVGSVYVRDIDKTHFYWRAGCAGERVRNRSSKVNGSILF